MSEPEQAQPLTEEELEIEKRHLRRNGWHAIPFHQLVRWLATLDAQRKRIEELETENAADLAGMASEVEARGIERGELEANVSAQRAALKEAGRALEYHAPDVAEEVFERLPLLRQAMGESDARCPKCGLKGHTEKDCKAPVDIRGGGRFA